MDARRGTLILALVASLGGAARAQPRPAPPDREQVPRPGPEADRIPDRDTVPDTGPDSDSVPVPVPVPGSDSVPVPVPGSVPVPVPDSAPVPGSGSDPGGGAPLPVLAPDAVVGSPAPAGAIDPDATGGGIEAGPDFGPLISIEAIEIVGNRSTASRVIRRALPIAPGDVLRTGDPRLKRARWKLLALGYFLDVSLALRKGSARGQVIVTVTVLERGTVALNRLWFGTSVVAPYWLGADVSDRNFLGSGLAFGGAVAFADHGAITGARDQWAGELRLSTPGLRGSPWGLHGAITGQRGSEPYRVGGPYGTSAAENLRAFSYSRLGARAGTSYDLSTVTELAADLRVEAIDAAVPVAPTRALPDGRIAAIDLGLRRGDSRVVSLAVGLDRDTRPDPALPHAGTRLQLQAELGSSLLGGSYDFAVLLGRYDRWWPTSSRTAIGVRVAGGAILGDAPRFDRIHVADVDRLLSPRVLGMTTAVTSPLDLLGTDNADALYGEVGGNVVVEYVYRWWRRPRRIYGADAFVAVGVWGLATADELRSRDRPVWDALPVDAVIDAGLRIDTEIGVFEFTLANALGRVPRW